MERKDSYTRANNIMSALYNQKNKTLQEEALQEGFLIDVKNVAMSLAARKVKAVKVSHGVNISNISSRAGMLWDHEVLNGTFIWGWGYSADDYVDPDNYYFTFTLEDKQKSQSKIITQFKVIAEKHLRGLTRIQTTPHSVFAQHFIVTDQAALRKINDFIVAADHWLENPSKAVKPPKGRM